MQRMLASPLLQCEMPTDVSVTYCLCIMCTADVEVPLGIGKQDTVSFALHMNRVTSLTQNPSTEFQVGLFVSK